MNPGKKYLILVSGLVLVFFLCFSYVFRKGKLFFSAPQIVISSGTVAFGDSLFAILVEENISADESQKIVQALSSVFNLKKCQPGDSYKILKSTSNDFVNLEYEDGSLNIYQVKKDISGGYVADKEKINLKKIRGGIKGEIKTSLYEAIIEQGGNAELAMKFADIFAWQVDFLTETRAGDTYEFIWEKYENKDRKISFNGNIIVARFQGKESSMHTTVLYEDEKGNSDYYSLKGESLRKEFLRAPLNYRRISSYFSYRRFHPILRYLRPHLAIDYAAPEGTPIASIGDGTVTFSAWEGGYGKLVIVRHNNVYSSYYGHLSHFGRGIRAGAKVKQGQVIGYVGSTGLATGPHLDFRIKKYGQFVNFLKIKLPSVKSVKKEEMTKFEQVKKERLAQLAKIASKGGQFPGKEK